METNNELMRDARPEFLDNALRCGAMLTGKPDGSEAITVVFTIEAWRAFDALSQRSEAVPTILKPGISHEKCANAFAESLDGYSYAKHIRDFAREWFQTGWFSLSKAIRSELEQPAPAPSAAAGEQVDWMECERISNEDHVDEALRTFSDDPTQDNATGVIQAVITVYNADRAALAAQPTPAQGKNIVPTEPPKEYGKLFTRVYEPKPMNKAKLYELVQEYANTPSMGQGRIRADVWADILEVVEQAAG